MVYAPKGSRANAIGSQTLVPKTLLRHVGNGFQTDHEYSRHRVDLRPGGVGALAPRVKALVASAVDAKPHAVAPRLEHASPEANHPATAWALAGVLMPYRLLAYLAPRPVDPGSLKGSLGLGLSLSLLPLQSLQVHAPVKLAHPFVSGIG